MDTKEFLGQLQNSLLAEGLTKEQIDPRLAEMSEYLTSLSDADREKELTSLSANIGKITTNIARQYADNQNETPVRTSDEDDDVKVAPQQFSEDTRAKRNNARRAARSTTSSMTRVQTTQQNVFSAETVQMDPIAQKNEGGYAPAETKRPVRSETQVRKNDPDAAYVSSVKFSELDAVAPVDQKNQILFWVVFALTLPITLAALLLILGVFAAIFLVLAAIVTLCIGALVGVTAAGSIVSLFGLVYGVTQLFSCPPAGLYEIGFAIKIAGAALLIGIIVYNIAIRLIPWIMKKFYELFMYVAKKIYKLFLFIRRECTGK